MSIVPPSTVDTLRAQPATVFPAEHAGLAPAEETMRIEAASKNNPADLIDIALEMLVGARLEIPRFSSLDTTPPPCGPG
ncbi:hypothetical protein GCM10009639_18960 [Kitasatospora putterlickiae]|uniref:Uncharacterized protein n=1 Tax=Kitasatospora putterlickiae TaxID=221725 RepID=A0ABP4IGI9_9ACTN